MKFIILNTFFFLSIIHLLAQSDLNYPVDYNIFTEIVADTNGGEITIYQDTAIEQLILKDVELNSEIRGIQDGFRIQIISVSGRNAREESNFAEDKFKEIYPDFDPYQIYKLYQAPFFKIRVGNYRDKHEALKFYKDVLKYFPNAYLVKGQIEYPKLD